MDKELRYFLEQGPTSVKELARLTGKSTSTIYKALKNDEVQQATPESGASLFFIVPEAKQDGAGETKPTEAGQTPTPKSGQAPASTGKRGRKPTASNKRLTAVCEGNERRQNSHGYRSLQIVLDNPGITTEDYLLKGGRLNDLRWDIAHGNVKAE